MENAVQALKMAFGMLIFVVALSISIATFSQVRATAQSIINIRDRENEFEPVDYSMDSLSREVGEETIIPALYRAYKEDYIVVFEGIGNVWEIWDETLTPPGFRPTNIIDLKEQRIENQTKATQLIDNLLSGNDFNDSFYKHAFESGGLFGAIEGKTFIETQGIYYNLDVVADGDDANDEGTDTPDVNKAEKRVITYTLKQPS